MIIFIHKKKTYYKSWRKINNKVLIQECQLKVIKTYLAYRMRPAELKLDKVISALR